MLQLRVVPYNQVWDVSGVASANNVITIGQVWVIPYDYIDVIVLAHALHAFQR